MANRREFLTASLATAVALVLSSTVLAKASSPLKILVLGGTGFLGPHFVEAARARGHVLTLFNRGKTNPGLFPDIEKLQGDRKTDLKALEGRHWDAVLDTSAYIPADVTRSAGLLSKNVDRGQGQQRHLRRPAGAVRDGRRKADAGPRNGDPSGPDRRARRHD